MKVTKLVIRFNYKKLLAGLAAALLLFILAEYIENENVKSISFVFGILIVINVVGSIIASYILYDKSDLFKLKNLDDYFRSNRLKTGVLIHASFDPVSKSLEDKYRDLNLTVCDIYGNRHEHESGIQVSKKIFPPNRREIKIDPTKLPFDDNSQEFILAITALHEILSHEKRIRFFKEAKRILERDGLIIVAEQFRNLTNFLFFNIGAFHFISQNKWERAIEMADLEIVENRKVTPFANLMIIKKKINGA
jgi:hypothetical protein